MSSSHEMVKAMTKHVMEKHPDLAKTIQRMHDTDPKKWGSEVRPKWEAAPELNIAGVESGTT